MSDIRRIGAGARMSKAVIHGSTVYTAGQVAEKTKGGSVSDQTREILSLIDQILSEAGSEKEKILSATIYLSDIATFAEMNSVWTYWNGAFAEWGSGKSKFGEAMKIASKNLDTALGN